MGRSDKKRALRLFLYLRAAGRTPSLQAANYFEWAAMLSKEYGKLTPDVRKTPGRLAGNSSGRLA